MNLSGAPQGGLRVGQNVGLANVFDKFSAMEKFSGLLARAAQK